MATSILRLIADVRDLCGKPTREQVGDDQILGVLLNTQRRVINEFNLGSENRILERVEFALTSTEMDLPVSDFDAAERVEITTGADNSYERVQLANLSELELTPNAGAPAFSSTVSRVAFAGGRMYFDGVPANATVRLWYKPVYREPEALTDGLRGIAESVITYVKLATAAFIREVYLNLPVPPSMQSEIVMLERQMKRQATESNESGLVKKQRYRGNRGPGGALAPGLGRYRFFRR